MSSKKLSHHRACIFYWRRSFEMQQSEKECVCGIVTTVQSARGRAPRGDRFTCWSDHVQGASKLKVSRDSLPVERTATGHFLHGCHNFFVQVVCSLGWSSVRNATTIFPFLDILRHQCKLEAWSIMSLGSWCSFTSLFCQVSRWNQRTDTREWRGGRRRLSRPWRPP